MASSVVRNFSSRVIFFQKCKHFLSKTSKTSSILCIRGISNKSTSFVSTSIPEFEGRPGINSYKDLYEFSLDSPDQFWATLARSRLKWFKDFDRVQDCDLNEGKISWFLNGKINVSGKLSLSNNDFLSTPGQHS